MQRHRFTTMCMYGATYEGVDDTIQKHHNTSPDCTIVTLNSSLYLDYFAIVIKQISTDVCHRHVP